MKITKEQAEKVLAEIGALPQDWGSDNEIIVTFAPVSIPKETQIEGVELTISSFSRPSSEKKLSKRLEFMGYLRDYEYDEEQLSHDSRS